MTRGGTTGLAQGGATALEERVAGLERDRSADQQALVELRRERDLLRRLMDTSPAGVVVVDALGHITLASARAERVLGLERDPAGGYREEPWRLHEVDGSPVADLARPLRRVLEARAPVEDLRYSLLWPDGRRTFVSINGAPFLDDDGQLAGAVFSVDDLTDELEVQAELAKYQRHLERLVEERTSDLTRVNEQYRLLLERMNEGFATTDEENRFTFANAKLIEMLGYSREELQGRSILELVDVDNRERLEAQQERRRRGEAEPYDLTWTAKDGRLVHTIVSPTPLHDADGRFLGSFAVIADVTERKRAEEERKSLEGRIQRAQKLESLGLLAGGVAHDFNNLLVGVLGNAGLALMKVELQSPLRPILEQIETAAQRASELTREMLAYSGKGKFVVEPIDLSRLVTEMAQLLEVTIHRKARLELDVAERLPHVEGDPTQIRQVVMNLITNASEAIEDRSGVIQVETGVLRADRAYLSRTYLDDDLPEGTYVFLRVSDSGCGMSPETRLKIFDPFFTTKFTGRGLGLAAVLGIVRGHGGAIRVESEVGSGSTITVLLPPDERRPVVASPAPQPPLWEPAAAVGGQILVVDDEPMVVGIARACLEQVGFRVLAAGDGREAVELFRDGATAIDAVLLDMTMPRMGGEEAFRELRKIRPDVPIVLSSGYDEQEAIAGFGGQGLAGFLQKPFQPRQLIELMRRVTTSAERG